MPCSSICNITVIMIQNGELNKAQRLAERLLSSKPQSPCANSCKAHGLTLLSQIEEGGAGLFGERKWGAKPYGGDPNICAPLCTTHVGRNCRRG